MDRDACWDTVHGAEQSGMLQSLGPPRVGHDLATNIHTHTHTQICCIIISPSKSIMIKRML